MRKAIDSNGNVIGSFDGISIKSVHGVILYRVIDSEVYQPIEYSENELQFMNKGQMVCVGILNKNNAVSNEGDLLFKIS